MSTVAENIKKVQAKIREAAIDCGRNADEIQIIAISKYADKKQVAEAIKLGVSMFGESRPQQLEQRAEWFESVEIDFVGHLQRNKVKKVVPLAERIHSVDSLRLAEEIDKESSKVGKTQKIFLQINISEEEQKFGFQQDEVPKIIGEIDSLIGVEPIGLMAMASQFATKEETKKIFLQLATMRDNLRKNTPSIKFLSMGMSGDYIQAVESGATHLRIGSAIFRQREEN